MTIVGGISRIGYMSGGKAARWVDEDMADTITQKAIAFIEKNKSKLFFLYFSTHDIHVPRVPHPRFVGKTDMGPRGDVIVQLDWCVGEILKTLEKNGLADDTLVIFASDNGPVVDDGYRDQAVEKLGDHQPAGPWRGGKYSNFEGGTRVPLIVRRPKRIKPGESDALVSQIDFPASLAALIGRPLPPDAAPDSFNVLAALLGESQVGRDPLVEQAGVLSLRQGPWKLIQASKRPKVNKNTNTELGNAPRAQLYNTKDDPGEMQDLAPEHPEKVKELGAMLEKIRRQGRSRP
jgi:arylsulfatase A-like enzyme